MRMVLIEGVPGTGKSTMAEKLCSFFVRQGQEAYWYLEESHDHPVHPKSRRSGATQKGFDEECLDQWSKFVRAWADKETVHIFDGSAFQSTVRFMMERRLPGIETYYRRFEEILCNLNAQMVYMRPLDVYRHSEYVCKLRGGEWSSKVSRYLEGTSYSDFHALQGMEGMHRFWNVYAKLCDDLVMQTSIPTRIIHFIAGDWKRHMGETIDFVGSHCFGQDE